MPRYFKITPILEITNYIDLIEADSLEEAEAGNYVIVEEDYMTYPTGEECSLQPEPFVEEADPKELAEIEVKGA